MLKVGGGTPALLIYVLGLRFLQDTKWEEKN